jgi:class 3 adenylate cyclase
MATVEKILGHLLDLVGSVCREFGGTNRFGTGDSYCLTFLAADRALEAVERLSRAWGDFQERAGISCGINIAVHKGTLNLFRSYLHGRDVNAVAVLESATKELAASGGIFVTDRVTADLAQTPWIARLQRVELARRPRFLEDLAIYRLV